jgi:hypothetical protein
MTETIKPTLAMTPVPTFRVKYLDLQEFISQVYSMDFDFLRAAGLTNGMIPEYTVQGTILPALDGLRARLRMGRSVNNISLILNDLAAEGHIPLGRYIIDTHKKRDDTELYRTLLYETKNPGSPECMAFKAAHRQNKVLQERFAILDEEMLKELHRSRRKQEL